jgi:predicted DNA-binding transcriptional regulator AlpA
MTALSRSGDDIEPLMKANETAEFLRVSESWLAKARMRGEGPPFVQIGRSVRYSKAAVNRWLKSQERRGGRNEHPSPYAEILEINQRT